MLLVDGDIGLSSLEVLLGLRSERTIANVLAGDCAWTEALIRGPGGVHVMPAAAGRPDLTSKRPRQLTRLIAPLLEAKHHYDLVLIDLGAGVGQTVISLAMACDRLLLLTTPEPTALADAYAVLKVLVSERRPLPVEALINLARDEHEARETYDRLRRAASHFLGVEPKLFGHLPFDPRVGDAVTVQQPVIEAFPASRYARALRGLTSRLVQPAARPAGSPSSERFPGEG